MIDDPRQLWIDDVVKAFIGASFAALIAAMMPADKSDALAVWIIIAGAGICYLSMKHASDAGEPALPE